MSVWFVRTGGVNTNSGGGDTDAPTIDGEAGTDFVVAGGTGLTYAPGGLSSLPANATGPSGYTRSVNLNIGGTRTVRKITVLTDTTATLDASVADGSYGGSVGGARPGINNSVGTGSGENPRLAAGDDVYLQSGATFTETSIVFDGTIRFHGRGATIDGTGGGAGTDILATGIAVSPLVENVILANAVDRGFSSNQGGLFYMTRIQSPGGIGLVVPGSQAHWYVSVRSAAGTSGATNDNNPASTWTSCEFIDCTGVGITLTRGGRLIGSLAADCGNGGAVIAHDVQADDTVVGCTFEGNTGIGLSSTGNLTGSHTAANNTFTNNSTYGYSAESNLAGTVGFFDFNHYHGNGTAARNNVPTGANDLSGDPMWVSAATDDYTPGPNSPLLSAGHNPWKNSSAPTIGAVGASQDSFSGGSGSGRSTIFPSPWCSH